MGFFCRKHFGGWTEHKGKVYVEFIRTLFETKVSLCLNSHDECMKEANTSG